MPTPTPIDSGAKPPVETPKPIDSTFSSNLPKGAWWAIFILVVVILIGYARFLIYMAINRGMADLEWARMTFLFTGFEVLTFGAAGFVFGREVYRRAVQSADRAYVNAETQKNQAIKQQQQSINEKATIEKQKNELSEKLSIQKERGQIVANHLRSAIENDPIRTFGYGIKSQSNKSSVDKQHPILKLINNWFPEK